MSIRFLLSLLLLPLFFAKTEVQSDSVKLYLKLDTKQFYYQVVNKSDKVIRFNIHDMNSAYLFRLKLIDASGNEVSKGCGTARLNFGFVYEHETNYRKIYPNDTLSVMIDPPLCQNTPINIFIPQLIRGASYKAVLLYEMKPASTFNLPPRAFTGELRSDTVSFVW